MSSGTGTPSGNIVPPPSQSPLIVCQKEERYNLLRILERHGSESQCRDSLRMHKRFHGEYADHPDIAGSLYQVGMILLEKGDIDGAESLYRASLGMMQRIHGKNADQRGIAGTLHQLGVILQLKGDLGGAESRYRASLCMQQRMLGETRITRALPLRCISWA